MTALRSRRAWRILPSLKGSGGVKSALDDRARSRQLAAGGNELTKARLPYLEAGRQALVRPREEHVERGQNVRIPQPALQMSTGQSHRIWSLGPERAAPSAPKAGPNCDELFDRLIELLVLPREERDHILEFKGSSARAVGKAFCDRALARALTMHRSTASLSLLQRTSARSLTACLFA